MSEDVQQCRRCKATDETQPLEGINDDGLCLICADKRQEEREKERQRRIDERYRAALADDETEQAALDEVLG